jgi:outer membrane lipoprotein
MLGTSIRLLLVTTCLLAAIGCASNRAVPKEFASQVDRSVSYSQVAHAPEALQGRLLVLGGEVVSARRVKEGTQLEILELPLDRRDRPTGDRMRSEGRFYALSKEPIDPATIVPGTPVTLVAEVTGSEVGRLDEASYRFPTVEVRHLTVWDPRAQPGPYARPGVGVSIGGGYGSWGGGFGGLGIGLGF